jgi:hypothetical protein
MLRNCHANGGISFRGHAAHAILETERCRKGIDHILAVPGGGAYSAIGGRRMWERKGSRSQVGGLGHGMLALVSAIPCVLAISMGAKRTFVKVSS